MPFALIGGCATQMQSQPLSRSAAATLHDVEVKVLVAGSRPSVNWSAANYLEYEQVAGVVPAPVANSGSGIVGTAIGVGIINAIIAFESGSQTEDSQLTLLGLTNVLDEKFVPSLILEEANRVFSAAKDIRVEQANSPPAENKSSNQRQRPKQSALMTLTFSQSMSTDLSRLRLRLHANVRSASGETLMNQVFYYLPPSVEGATKADAVETWKANDAKLYRDQIALGTEALFDALNSLFLSYRATPEQSNLADASQLLKNKHCYGGDYDVGIPLADYDQGRLLAERAKYTMTILRNNAVLIFPTCAI